LNSPTDKHPSPERVAPAPGPGDRLADALTGALQRSFPHGVAPAPDAQEPVPAGWPISPDDPPCVCGHTLPMHLWIDGKRVESLSGCGNRYCDCDHYRPAQAPAVAQPSGAAEAEPEVISRESVYMGLRNRIKALEAALASAQQERDEARLLEQDQRESATTISKQRDNAQAQLAALQAQHTLGGDEMIIALTVQRDAAEAQIAALTAALAEARGQLDIERLQHNVAKDRILRYMVENEALREGGLR
jgi:hypothetical protein